MVVSDVHEDRWGKNGSMSNFLALCIVHSLKFTGVNFPPLCKYKDLKCKSNGVIEKRVRNKVTVTFEDINRSFYL